MDIYLFQDHNPEISLYDTCYNEQPVEEHQNEQQECIQYQKQKQEIIENQNEEHQNSLESTKVENIKLYEDESTNSKINDINLNSLSNTTQLNINPEYNNLALCDEYSDEFIKKNLFSTKKDILSYKSKVILTMSSLLLRLGYNKTQINKISNDYYRTLVHNFPNNYWDPLAISDYIYILEEDRFESKHNHIVYNKNENNIWNDIDIQNHKIAKNEITMTRYLLDKAGHNSQNRKNRVKQSVKTPSPSLAAPSLLTSSGIHMEEQNMRLTNRSKTNMILANDNPSQQNTYRPNIKIESNLSEEITPKNNGINANAIITPNIDHTENSNSQLNNDIGTKTQLISDDLINYDTLNELNFDVEDQEDLKVLLNNFFSSRLINANKDDVETSNIKLIQNKQHIKEQKQLYQTSAYWTNLQSTKNTRHNRAYIGKNHYQMMTELMNTKSNNNKSCVKLRKEAKDLEKIMNDEEQQKSYSSNLKKRTYQQMNNLVKNTNNQQTFDIKEAILNEINESEDNERFFGPIIQKDNDLVISDAETLNDMDSGDQASSIKSKKENIENDSNKLKPDQNTFYNRCSHPDTHNHIASKSLDPSKSLLSKLLNHSSSSDKSHPHYLRYSNLINNANIQKSHAFNKRKTNSNNTKLANTCKLRNTSQMNRANYNDCSLDNSTMNYKTLDNTRNNKRPSFRKMENPKSNIIDVSYIDSNYFIEIKDDIERNTNKMIVYDVDINKWQIDSSSELNMDKQQKKSSIKMNFIDDKNQITGKNSEHVKKCLYDELDRFFD